MTSVFITTSFAALHHWPNAPDNVAFLRNEHRHVFHVRVEKAVGHDEREIEFITLKSQTAEVILEILRTENTLTWSCETWAKQIGLAVDASVVEVSEDKENGAEWRTQRRVESGLN